MTYIADLHIHSRFSQACSKELNIPNLAKWAKIKGINLMGTGDCLHPVWLEELKKNLYDGGTGIYTPSATSGVDTLGVKFMLTTEVSCIYSEGGKGRRVHILLFFPSFAAAFKMAEKLTSMGVNLKADGRPIMGLSVKKVCEIAWKIDNDIMVIPAHIWTPWFGMFGSKSGYNFLGECFGEYSSRIYAVETGLSSEPQMNWRVSELDDKAIVSFSDAHSLPNLGRELTIFKSDLQSYHTVSDDIKNQNIVATIEFFPEEGKYHYSGHRACGVVYDPDELKEHGKICPKCHRELMQRVEELSTRSNNDLQIKREAGSISSASLPNRPPFQMLVGLEKIIAEALGVGTKTKKVEALYTVLTQHLGTELFILTKASVADIKALGGQRVGSGVERMRLGQLEITPGFDNTYGKVKIFDFGI
jgi:uncharacterized protein (TIGR00375 family)